ncbi:HNH endonuclease OS=Streptomyces microflavus OX=1919 GN=Smic_27790 PE=4 SV=1 [Streptomyces microflavus]
MGNSPYTRELLEEAIAASANWTDLMRRLGLPENGGRRRTLQRKAAEYELDTSHFKQRSPWKKYPDSAIAAAVKCSTSLREVVNKLGVPPASGTLSHIGRRIAAAGIDVSHFPGLNRPQLDLPFTTAELRAAAASAESIRGTARSLGIPDDGRSRSALASLLRRRGVGTSHFRNARLAVPEDALRHAVPRSTSYADVMRALGLEVNDTNHRRVRRKTVQLKLDTGHFIRRSWTTQQVPEPSRRSRRRHSRRRTSRRIPHQPHTASPRPAEVGRTAVCRAATRANGWDSHSRSRSITSTVTG